MQCGIRWTRFKKFCQCFYSKRFVFQRHLVNHRGKTTKKVYCFWTPVTRLNHSEGTSSPVNYTHLLHNAAPYRWNFRKQFILWKTDASNIMRKNFKWLLNWMKFCEILYIAARGWRNSAALITARTIETCSLARMNVLLSKLCRRKPFNFHLSYKFVCE